MISMILKLIYISSILLVIFFCTKKPKPYQTKQQSQTLDSEPSILEPSYVRIKRHYFKNLYITIALFCIIFVGPFGCAVATSWLNPNDPTASQGAGWLMILAIFLLGPAWLIAVIYNTAVGVSYYWAKMKTPKEERLKWEAAQRAEKERKKQQAEQEKIEQKRLSDLQKPQVVTPLLQSILDGNKEAAEKALKEYPDYINIPYASNGNTPLHVTVWNGYTDIVKLLLEQPGIDLYIKNKDGKTALDLAQEKNLTEIVNLLQNR